MDRRQFVYTSAIAGAALLAGCMSRRNEQESQGPVDWDKVPEKKGDTSQPSGERDIYGGWTGLKGRATGYFHTEFIGNDWWLVTPLGNAFWSKGVNHVRYDEHVDRNGKSEWHENNIAKYGNENAWATATFDRLEEWGFNTIGAWSSLTLYDREEMPYTKMVYFNEDGGSSDAYSKWGIPDVFDPEFTSSLEGVAERWVAPRADDPYCIGYFLGNEMHWSADWRSQLSVLEVYLQLDSPGRERAERFLSDRGKDASSIDDQDRNDFLGQVADEFFSQTSSAVRKKDSNHMILAPRFAGSAPEAVLERMADHVDIVAINSYNSVPDAGYMSHVTNVTGKPVMQTEFAFRARDSGLPNSNSSGEIVDTQEQRGQKLAGFFTELAKIPSCVGGHMFEFSDQPAAGRQGDGQDSNYGLVNVNDEPYGPVVRQLSETLPQLERRRIA